MCLFALASKIAPTTTYVDSWSVKADVPTDVNLPTTILLVVAVEQGVVSSGVVDHAHLFEAVEAVVGGAPF